MKIDEAIEHAKEVTKKVNCKECADEHEQLAKWLEELKHYKELEEQGKLIRLDCKVGDTVYVNDEYKEYKITGYERRFGFFHYNASHMVNEDERENIGFSKRAIGRKVFLTKEEAEQKKLEEIKNADK